MRNQSGVVDSFELQVTGLPRRWSTVTPRSLDLVPFGADSGASDAEATIVLEPPRSPEARAGAWPVEVIAVSRVTGQPAASASVTLVIGAFERFESRVRPERARGTRSARFAVPVRNLGNAPLVLALHGEDADGEAKFRFDPPRLEVGVGEEAHAIATASASQPLSGSARERRLTVYVDGAEQSLSGTAIFVQRPLLSRGAITGWRIALGLLAVALLALAGFAEWTSERAHRPLHGRQRRHVA